MSSSEVENCPLLIYANKIDLEGHLTKEEVSEGLKLNELKQKWQIFECSAIKNEGIQDGVDWAVKMAAPESNIPKSKKKKKWASKFKKK